MPAYAPRISDDAVRGRACCCWDTFRGPFETEYADIFGLPPNKLAWQSAIADWRSGNTGFEAAHNARARLRATAQYETGSR